LPKFNNLATPYAKANACLEIISNLNRFSPCRLVSAARLFA